ncbi:MAG: CHASE2 domain-containing protein [Burkholderiaceae bacterium]|nr:CHASE2 domain-containing protein [Burkholderiaceae bacterium]
MSPLSRVSAWIGRLCKFFWVRKELSGLYGAGLCLTFLMALLSVFQPLAVQKADLAVYDLMLRGRASPPQSNVPVVVGIDENSLASFGQWPWPRYRLALLIEQLQRLGAQVVVLDFLMPESDRTAPEVIQIERRRDRVDAKNTSTTATAPAYDGNSRRLADALGQGPTVLGYYLDFSQPTALGRSLHPPTPPAGMVVSRSSHGTGQWPKPQGQIRSLPLLTDAASAEGFTNALQDIDGTLRRVPLLLSSPQGQDAPSLALAAALLSSSQRSLRLDTHPAGAALRWGDRNIPLDRSGNLLLNWHSSPAPYLSAGSVLDGTVPAGSLRGKIAVVGAWAQGLGDRHLTPSGKSMYGVAVHATVIDNLLSGTFIVRPSWARGAELLAVLLAGGLCTLLLGRPGFTWSVLVVVLGTVGLYTGAYQLLLLEGVHLSPLLPILALVLITSVLSLLKYGFEAHKLLLRTQELSEAQDGIITSLSVLSEARDKETGGHILRTQSYVKLLAQQLSTTPAYEYLTDSDIELLTKSAPLHDIGKVGIPDSILQKPGKLTPEEYAIMQNHPLIGAQALAKIMAGTGHPEQKSFLDYARQMVEAHHERWDGSGYPHRLSGQAIPLAGRLMALADVYDALISKRVYKRGFSHDEVRQMLIKDSGSHFDPDVVAAFLAREADFVRVAEEFADPHEPPPEALVVPALAPAPVA